MDMTDTAEKQEAMLKVRKALKCAAAILDQHWFYEAIDELRLIGQDSGGWGLIHCILERASDRAEGESAVVQGALDCAGMAVGAACRFAEGHEDEGAKEAEKAIEKCQKLASGRYVAGKKMMKRLVSILDNFDGEEESGYERERQ